MIEKKAPARRDRPPAGAQAEASGIGGNCLDYLIVACHTLENELKAALPCCTRSYDLAWIDAQLHNVKSRFRDAVQEILDGSDGYQAVLFATSFCGNAVQGLQARGAPLVIPRVDDCISLLLGGVQKKHRLLSSYFLTDGWLRGRDNIWNEYQRAIRRYGEETAQQIFHVMLSNYRKLTLLDTGCYDLEASKVQAAPIADAFSLELTVEPASIDYLRRLLTGPWEPEQFLTVPPHETITGELLTQLYQ